MSTIVLLIDDQPFIGAALRDLLDGAADVDLRCCHEPLKALSIANQVRPTVILQDLVMPEIDGLALLRWFHRNPATAATPVIVLSGNDDEDTRARAMEEGAADFLVKLPSRDALLACIRRHAAFDRSVIATLKAADPAGSAGLSTRLIQQFLQEARERLEVLHGAVSRGDAAAINAQAHALKGSSMTIGARRLAGIASRMEDLADSPLSLELALKLLRELDQEFLTVGEALAKEAL